MCFSKVRRIFLSEKSEFFKKWGFSGFFCPHRHISAVAAANLDEIFTQCSDVDEKSKN